MHRFLASLIVCAAVLGLALLGTSVHAADISSLEGQLAGAEPGQKTEKPHVVIPQPGEKVAFTLRQTPVHGVGCLSGEQFHMYVFEGEDYQKLEGNRSINVGACTHTLSFTSDEGEPLTVVVENWSTTAVPYEIDVEGAVPPTPTPTPTASAPTATPVVGDPDTGFGLADR